MPRGADKRDAIRNDVPFPGPIDNACFKVHIINDVTLSAHLKAEFTAGSCPLQVNADK